MVEKRTLALLVLTVLVWASTATGFMTYYYVEQTRFKKESAEKQGSLNELARDYSVSVGKRNLLTGEYAVLLGEFQWFSGQDYTQLIGAYWRMLQNLNGNYTETLKTFPELNATYAELSKRAETIAQNLTVTKDEFGSLLDEFYEVFNAVSTRELETFISKTSTIRVSLCIDYGNETIGWHNVSTPSATTLFNLTRSIARVKYTYWPALEPGHMLLDSINNHTSGYWMWYYWGEAAKDWVLGPVGCDAWVLRDEGVYKWVCFS